MCTVIKKDSGIQPDLCDMHKTIAKMFVNSEPVKHFKISPSAFSFNVFFSLSCTFSFPLIQ